MQVEVAEDVAFAFVETVSETVGDEGVACETLDLLYEEPEREMWGSVEGSRGGRG